LAPLCKLELSSTSLDYILSIPRYIHVYRNDEDGEMDVADGDDDFSAFSQTFLPAQSLSTLWDSLYYEAELKSDLLAYVQTSLLFADGGVRADWISSNRVLLLHGPPGTGKTSLCRALANKLAIRLSHRYPSASLLEINAHSLFSKWFSESGKLVMKLFERIREELEDSSGFVLVLIDEVESLTAARAAAVAGSEPSDAVRVVNALLTQLDSLRKYPNVLVLATSNVTEAIDDAFVDRADIKVYIGNPNEDGRSEILCSGAAELMRCGILERVRHVMIDRSFQCLLMIAAVVKYPIMVILILTTSSLHFWRIAQ
jgi:pachytene checkpoint protein 2